MPPDIGLIMAPEVGPAVLVGKVDKLPTGKEVVFDGVERPLHRAVPLFRARGQDDDFKAVFVGKLQPMLTRWIQDSSSIDGINDENSGKAVGKEGMGPGGLA